jgi:hypothetical protein
MARRCEEISCIIYTNCYFIHRESIRLRKVEIKIIHGLTTSSWYYMFVKKHLSGRFPHMTTKLESYKETGRISMLGS